MAKMITYPNPDLEIFIYELPELLNSVIASAAGLRPSHLCLHKTVGFINAVKDMLAMTGSWNLLINIF